MTQAGEVSMLKRTFADYRVPLEAVVVVAVLVAIRWVLWEVGLEGMTISPLASSIVSGGVFVMGLVVAGTLSDYRDAERAPTDLASGLYNILRETESMERTWGKPDMGLLRQRLIDVVVSLRSDINAGNTRACQAAIEELSESFAELEESDVPANYVVRLRQEQAGLRKSVLKVYQLQREQFLPSAKAMIVSIVIVILAVLMFTDMGGVAESLVTLAFMSFFFLALFRLLNVIDKPFKVGRLRTDDDVSLFTLSEFVVQVEASVHGEVSVEEVEAQAEEMEEVFTEVEHEEAVEAAAFIEANDEVEEASEQT